MATEALEEADVDVCESWEDMDESGLDQLKFISPPPPVRPSLCKVDILVDENLTLGTQYMMPEPAIRILKRPESSSNGQMNGESARRPMKTLEQRQREYEEARLRILGEARSPEDVIDENLSRIQDKLQASTISSNVRVKERPSTALPVAERGAIMLARRSPPPGVLVLRAPRAPDGTRGFNVSSGCARSVRTQLLLCRSASWPVFSESRAYRRRRWALALKMDCTSQSETSASQTAHNNCGF